ncbi:flagellar motor protein MotB [Gymnodinialimonas sp. 2305UL16-5]|uniref:flagellar motor protein MotB n=1 Tax=Gymnodinialimonas mytili TaxID=3126503 RepID=UPI0030983BE7
MAENDVRPIIIKRKKVSGGGGHHGGAWKVAYADFVTAMMAFFMLMWLLNATTENQQKGLADYFSPSVPIARVSGGGDGAFGGETPFSENVVAQEGTGATSDRPTEGRQAMGMQGTDHRAERIAEDAALAEIEGSLTGSGGDALLSDLAQPHIATRLTDEGLVIEVFSRVGAPIFDPVTQDPQPWMAELMSTMADLFSTVSNRVAVEAHVAAEPLVRTTSGPWDRTTARAQSVRGLLEFGGLNTRRIVRVTGHADREPVVEPLISPRNDRVEIILLRNAY